MAQAITITAPPAKYGRAYAEIVNAAAALTTDQVDELNRLYRDWPETAPRGIYERIDAAIELFRPVHEHHVLEPLAAVDAADAVLARDRGVITSADFAALTAVWVAAGHPLPGAITGDSEVGPFTPINAMTSDLISDELLHAANGTPEYGAVLMLTGYNVGELLAHQSVRGWIDRHNNQYKVDWAGLAEALDADQLGDLGEDARWFLESTTSLATISPTVHDVPASAAETVVIGVAYTYFLPHMINPHWETSTTTSPGPFPQARAGEGSGA